MSKNNNVYSTEERREYNEAYYKINAQTIKEKRRKPDSAIKRKLRYIKEKYRSKMNQIRDEEEKEILKLLKEQVSSKV